MLRRCHLFSRPTTLGIETTNYCNSKCLMCRSPEYRALGTGYMKMEVFERTRPFWKYASDLILGGNGECFLHPQYLDMAERIKETRASVHTFTNGTLLTPAICQRLVEMGFDLINISFDGASPASYLAIRGIDAFDQVIGNLKILRDIKRKYRVTKPIVFFNTIARTGILDELPDILYLAAELEVTQIQMFHLQAYYQPLRTESLWYDLQTANQKLAKAMTIAEKIGIKLSIPGFEEKQGLCIHPFSTMGISWEGRVSLCVNNRFWVGDIREESIQNIWNGSALKNIRWRVWKEGYSQLCPGCSTWDSCARNFQFPPVVRSEEACRTSQKKPAGTGL